MLNPDLKTLVKHLANGSLCDSLCVVCLQPFSDDNYENIFTSICKKDEEYCIADVLREVCRIEIQDTENFNLCIDCFQSASMCYQFYLQAKQSHEIVNFYVDQLQSNIEGLEINDEDSKRLLCIPLPSYTPETPGFDYGLDGIGQREMGDDIETDDGDFINNDEDEVILIVKDDQDVRYEVKMNDNDDDSADGNVLMIVNEKTRKKRDPMVFISCMHCPVRYRFLSKLKDHVKRVHDVDIYYCKICKLVTDDKASYEEHIQTHEGEYQCTECTAVYRRQDSLLAHLKMHEDEKFQLENLVHGNMCEVCGVVCADGAALAAHAQKHSARAHACYFCGRMYKGQSSLEAHLKKHEVLVNDKKNQHRKMEAESKPDKDSSKRSICLVCGKSFVDERSLMWHQRLHDNDRPFVCDICGRGFVSLNRRNQHATTAHSRPARRCPLCPALFHLTSMVNTHLKKVHLRKQQKKGRSRSTKHANVFWKTQTVPIQELSVAIQNEVLEIQTQGNGEWNNLANQSVATPPIPAKKYRKQEPTEYSKEQLYTLSIDPADLPDDSMMQEQFGLDTDNEFIDEGMV